MACSQRMMSPVAPCFLACAAAWGSKCLDGQQKLDIKKAYEANRGQVLS